VVQRGARVRRVPVVHRLQLAHPIARKRAQPLVERRHALERGAAALIRQRHGDVDLRPLREDLERVQLQRREAVEPVREDRRAAEVVRALAQRVDRPPRRQLLVRQPGRVEPVTVGAVDRSRLAQPAAARAARAPALQRALERRRLDHRALQLLDQPHGRAGEPGPRSGGPERARRDARDRLLHQHLALQVRRRTMNRRAAALADHAEQAAELHRARTQARAGARELAEHLLDVAPRGHDEDRLLADALAVGAQHLSRPARVRGPRDQLQGHRANVRPGPDGTPPRRTGRMRAVRISAKADYAVRAALELAAAETRPSRASGWRTRSRSR
jgi:hypothetical protein